jgi:hypothetical protein
MTFDACPAWCDTHPDRAEVTDALTGRVSDVTHWGPIHQFGSGGVAWVEARGLFEPTVVLLPTPEWVAELPLPAVAPLTAALAADAPGVGIALQAVLGDLAEGDSGAATLPAIDIPFTIDGDPDQWLRSTALPCGSAAKDDDQPINVFLVTDEPGADPNIFVQSVGSMTDDAAFDNEALQIDDPDVADRLAHALTTAAEQLRKVRKAATE